MHEDTQPVRPPRQRLAHVRAASIAVLAVACMVLSAVAISDHALSHNDATARFAAAFVVGALLYAAACWLAPPTPPAATLDSRLPASPGALGALGAKQRFARRRSSAASAFIAQSSVLSPQSFSQSLILTLFGVVQFALLLVVNNHRFTDSSETLRMVGDHAQLLLWLVGVGFVWLGAVRAAPDAAPVAASRVRPTRLRRLLPLLAVLLFACAVRLYRLDYIRSFIDEIHISTGTTHHWGEHHTKLLEPISSLMPFPRLFTLASADAVAIAGRSLFGLRLTPLAFGLLTVAAVYALGRALVSHRVGLLAALVLAAFPPAIQFSRIALINSADPFFGTLAFAAFAHALRLHRAQPAATPPAAPVVRWLALSGVLLGVVTYFYEGGKLLFPAVFAAWLVVLAVTAVLARPHGRPASRTFALRPLLVHAVIPFILVAAPLLISFALIPDQVKPRFSDARIEPGFWETIAVTRDLSPFLERIRNAFLIYVRLPDSMFYYGTESALVQPWVIPLLLLGVVAAFVRRLWLPLVWLALTVLGNALLAQSTVTARHVVAFPALAFLLALALHDTIALLLPSASPAPARRSPRAALVAVALVLTVYHTVYFHLFHLRAFNQQLHDSIQLDGHDALLRAAAFPPYTRVHLISADPPFTQQYADQLMAFLADDITVSVVRPEDITSEYMHNLSRDIDHAFFIAYGDTRSLANIAVRIPLAAPVGSPYAPDPVPVQQVYVLHYYRAADYRPSPG